ncbi:hypothetical protein [Joostella sp. CR20]|uniref:hypothetical protein n=1 Tax=Joostella sp. CR20 TaxID=2804312 RepID=UPI00313D8675
MIVEQKRIIKKLKENNSITYEEILGIANAFQIASGQGYAIGKTKGILDFLKKYGDVHIISIPEEGELILKTNNDLYILLRDIDNNIDIKADSSFETYF